MTHASDTALRAPSAAHAATVDETLNALDVTREGLSSDEAARRLEIVGPNRLPEKAPDPAWKRLLRHFNDVLIYVLLAAAVLKAFLLEWVDVGVILAVAIINALIGFVQEGRAQRALDGLRSMLSVRAQVRRGGEWVSTDAEKLVPGDVVRVKSGDRVPADIRITDSTELRAEEAGLTGESEPVTKGADPVDEGAGIGDRTSIGHSGSLVVSGRGTGIVIATGAETEIGRISTMIESVEQLSTPLERKIHRFSILLARIILTVAVLLIVFGFAVHDYPVPLLLTVAVAFAVAAIPEGLPAIVTITLSLGVQAMARRNAITRRLTSVETLGSVTVICSDKTGTLTKNEMTVERAVTAGDSYEVEGIGYQPHGSIRRDGTEVDIDAEDALRQLITVMAVANDASLREKDGRWSIVGEPTEGALVTLAHKASAVPEGFERLAVVPFESEHKLMATLDHDGNGDVMVHVKGAPDRVLDRCVAQLSARGEAEPLDAEWWHERVAELSSRGLRVLAAAQRPAERDTSELAPAHLDDDLVFVGVVGILDPPRPEAIEAIEAAKDAGVRVKMITGDHAGTATAIGRQMGIVAMTGDGINDAPALRRADVGVAMGIKGTEATKEAAEIVLADDNFATIARAVEEGRRTFDNIVKSVVFLLPTNGAQSLVLLVAVLLGLSIPLAPVQILWVNLIAAVTLSLALAFEPAEADVMKRAPRIPDSPIVGAAHLIQIALASVLIGGGTLAMYYLARSQGVDDPQAQSLAVTTLAIAQIGYLLTCRNLRGATVSPAQWFSNPIVWLSIGGLIVLQALFVYAPFMNTLFGSAPLPASSWALAFAIAAVVYIVIEVTKAITRRLLPEVAPR